MFDQKNRGIQQFGVLVNLLRDRQFFLEENLLIAVVTDHRNNLNVFMS